MLGTSSTPSPPQMSLNEKSGHSLTAPARKLGEFPLSQELRLLELPLTSPEMPAKGRSAGLLLQGSIYSAGTGKRPQHAHTHPLPHDLGTSAEGGKETQKDFQKIPFFKLSIFIIKIITSLVKVQMLQHGVKTPLE